MSGKTFKIVDVDKKSQYIIREYDDFEFVNPIEYISSMMIKSNMSLQSEMISLYGIDAPKDMLEKILLREATIFKDEQIERYRSTPVPKKVLSVLEAKSKKDQIKALNGLSLTDTELISFIMKAYEEHGFVFSQYKVKHNHKGLDINHLPDIIHLKYDGKIDFIGKTTLSEGQLKQAVEHRKVTVSKFLDRGDDWHCFFLTFRSISGGESYKNGQPHLHYISSKWNIPRKIVLEQLTSKDYRLPSLPHIDFYTHRNPRK